MVLSPRSLPPELWTEIVKLLPLADRQAFSLVSHSARNLVLPSLFGYLHIFGNPITPLRRIHDAGSDVKAVVRWVDPSHVQHREWYQA
jgi:F-box domain